MPILDGHDPEGYWTELWQTLAEHSNTDYMLDQTDSMELNGELFFLDNNGGGDSQRVDIRLEEDHHNSDLSSSPGADSSNKGRKVSHNAIEKRYRSKINAKFLALEAACQPASERDSAKRRNSKSDILANAIALIHQLQHQTTSMNQELTVLKTNLPLRWKMRRSLATNRGVLPMERSSGYAF